MGTADNSAEEEVVVTREEEGTVEEDSSNDTEQSTSDVDTEDAEKGGGSSETGDSATDEEADGEIEIVREGTQPQFSKQQVTSIVNKRVQRLNSQKAEATEQAAASNDALALAEEKNRLLQIALEQAKEERNTVERPDPSKFDEGFNDPEFIKQNDAYNDSIIDAKVKATVEKASENVNVVQQETAQTQALRGQQVKHYERAEKMGAKDYEATEDAALAVLGNEVANEVIKNFDDSQVILYYLGKNPAEAERIKNLLDTNPIRGVAEVGRLSSELKVKPKTKLAPTPDDAIKGDVSPSAKKGKGTTFE